MTSLLMIIMVVVIVATAFLAGHFATPAINFLLQKRLEPEGGECKEITFEIPTIEGEAPDFENLPQHIKRAIGSREKYDSAIEIANRRRLEG